MSARSTINLLPKTEFELSFWGRFLKWSLTAGRYIIILTELVVILAFLSRFKFDKDLLDLNDKIEGQQAILEATYLTETNFRSVQARLDQARQLLGAQMQASAIIDEIAQTVPSNTYLSSVLFDRGKINLDAATTSEQTVGAFIGNLRANKKWSNVSISDISSNGQEVTLTIEIAR